MLHINHMISDWKEIYYNATDIVYVTSLAGVYVILYADVVLFLCIKGRGRREPVGGGRRCYRYIIYLYIGGRGHAGASRRGKTVLSLYHIFIYWRKGRGGSW